jgi:hypothetical protein
VHPNSSSGTGGKPPLPTPPPTPPKTSKDSSDSDNEKAKGNGKEDEDNKRSTSAHTNKIEATPPEHAAVPKLRSCRDRKPSPYPHPVRPSPSVDSSPSSGGSSDEEEWDSDDEGSGVGGSENEGVEEDESQDGNEKGGYADGESGITGKGAGKVGVGEESARNRGVSRHARFDEDGQDGHEYNEEDDSDDYLYDDEDLPDASTQDEDHNNPNTDPTAEDGNEDLNVVQLLDRIFMSMTRNQPAVPAAPVNMHFRPDSHPSAQRRAELRDRLTNRGDDAYEIGYGVGLREAAMRRILTAEEWHALAVQTIGYCPGCPWCSQWIGYRGQGPERRGYRY